MIKFVKAAMVVALALTLMVACSQKSTEQQAAAPEKEQPAAAAQAPAQEPAAQEQAQQATQEQPQQAVSQQPQTEAAQGDQAAAKPEEISGTIVKTEEGIALFSDAGNFMITGQELESLVGKNVKVTGTIDEGSGKPVIKVTSVSVIE